MSSTLTAKVVDEAARRAKRRAILVTRSFNAQDFTRAWRSMRCWAWRAGYLVTTSKEEARRTGAVTLAKGPATPQETGPISEP